MIHPTAIISPSAMVDKTASVGAYAVIGDHSIIGADCVIENHAIIGANTTLGNNNRVFPFASIGLETQDKKIKADEQTYLIIGDHNIFREYCTVNRGTNHNSGGKTCIGSNNLLLAYTHVAHDCMLGDSIVMSNNAALGGHVRINDYAIISGFVAIQQFCHIGAYVFIGLGGMVIRDIPTYAITTGIDPKVRGVNIIGLKRHGFSKQNIELITKAYRLLYPKRGAREQTVFEVIKQIQMLADDDGILAPFIQFLTKDKGKNGLCT